MPALIVASTMSYLVDSHTTPSLGVLSALGVSLPRSFGFSISAALKYPVRKFFNDECGDEGIHNLVLRRLPHVLPIYPLVSSSGWLRTAGWIRPVTGSRSVDDVFSLVVMLVAPCLSVLGALRGFALTAHQLRADGARPLGSHFAALSRLDT
jgi:hypothetical protein